MKQTKDAVQLVLIGMIFLALPFVSCSREEPVSTAEPESRTELLLGTACRITIYDHPSDEAFTAAFDRIADIEARMSLHADTSEVAGVNRRAGIGPVAVSRDTFAVVRMALNVADLSRGAFDPTVGPLVKAWDIGGDNPRRPPSKEIDSLLPLIGYERVHLDESSLTVELPDPGMMLDLGGIAKGYAADEAAKVLASYGVSRAIINLGGNVLTMGDKPGGTPWRIGIQNPGAERGKHVMIVELTDTSLVTSGPYERYLELDGAIYHHIIDTRTGYPVDNTIISASIITDESFIADALSTAVYSLGLTEGMTLVDSLDGVEAVFIDSDKRIHLSGGMGEKGFFYTVSDGEFSVVP